MERNDRLRTQVHDLLRKILGPCTFPGAAALRAQVPMVNLAPSPLTLLALKVEGEAPPSDFMQGPIPVRALVTNVRGELIGEIIIWAVNGYLAKLEYAWTTDDPPVVLPPLEALTLTQGDQHSTGLTQ